MMMNLAARLEQMIRLVDLAAFPDKPLRIFVSCEPPPVGHPQLGLAHVKENPDQSFYFILTNGLEQHFQQGREFCIHFMLEREALARAFQKGAVYYTEEETLLAVSVHEVRHRVQFLAKATLFDASHTGRVLRCKYWTEKQAAHYKHDPNGAVEFDAKFFEQYVAQELRQGRCKLNAEDIGKLLHMNVEQFLEREKKIQ